MPKFLAPINLVQNELQNATIQNLAAAPSTPSKGQIYYDTANNRAYINIGTSGSPNWIDITTAAGGTNAFTNFTDGTNTAAADTTADTFTFSATSSVSALVSAAGDSVAFTALPAGIDHNSLANLTTGDPHTQYALLAGRASGQSLSGGTGTGDNLTLLATSNGTNNGAVVINTALSVSTSALTLTDAINVLLGSTTGTKFGTATTQKLAFYNSTPIIQPGATVSLETVLSNLGLRAAGSSAPLAIAQLTIADASDIVLGTTTGTKIGTSTTQKLGFFNATPIVQQANTADLKDVIAAFGFMVNGGASPLNLDGGAFTAGTISGTSGSFSTTLAVTSTSIFTGGTTHNGGISLGDAQNIIVGSTTGTKIGTATSQKLGFFNATPIIQPATNSDIRTALVNLGLLAGGANPLNLNGGGLTAAASSFSGDVAMGNNKITGLATPTLADDAATKAYVDGVATGLDLKQSVRLASTANVVVTYTATAGTSTRGQITASPNTLDGVTLVANDRILLKNQSTAAQNGIWIVSTVGTGANGVWDRTTDFDADAEVTAGAFAFVEEGTSNGNTGWVLTTDNPIVIGGASGTALTFAQFSGAGSYTAGPGLSLTGVDFSVNVNATNGTTINGDTVELTGLALALHLLTATDGIVSKTGASTVAARTITGTSNRLTVTNGGGAGGNPTLDISSAYVGQSSITTLGTITTGTWNGTDIAVADGGTGASAAIGASGAKENLNYAYRYAATITGDAVATTFTVTHNFATTNGFTNTQDLEVLVRETSGNFEQVFPDIRINNANSVSIVFGIAPANALTYRVIING